MAGCRGPVTVRAGEIAQYPGTVPTEAEQLAYAAACDAAEASAKVASDAARDVRKAKARTAYDELVRRLGQDVVDILPALMRAGGKPEEVE